MNPFNTLEHEALWDAELLEHLEGSSNLEHADEGASIRRYDL